MKRDMEQTRPKILRGIVVSDAMNKTRVVEIERYFKMPKYGKYIKRSKKFKAHDEANVYKKGDKVQIQEIKPMSKEKRWKIISKI